MRQLRVRVPSGRMCAGITLGIAAGLVTLWLFTLLGRFLHTTDSLVKMLLLPVCGIAVGCAVGLARAGTGVGASWGLLAAIASMFFCAQHMQYLSSNALHDRGQEVYGVIRDVSSLTDGDGVTTHTYDVSYPGNPRQRKLSTVGQELEVGQRYLITIDPQHKVRPALGPRPGPDVFHLVWQIVCAVFVMFFSTISVVLAFRPPEVDGW
ncbi:hypothetical protein ABT218_02075 [Streptomyces sp. NPDC001455]|uniref:hypothetical protein n=1 Tax=unclassified Streptomyces TaxID=2593676 RepID=UPI0033189C17